MRYIIVNSRYVDFTQIFACITTQYCPKLLISGAIENKSQYRVLRSCARSNLWLLSFNIPEYHPLQAYYNVETLASLIFEPFIPTRFGETGRKTVIIWVQHGYTQMYMNNYCFTSGHTKTRMTVLYPPTLAFTWSFSPGKCFCVHVSDNLLARFRAIFYAGC